MKPKVSIILPVYEKEKIFPLCLQSLTNLTYPQNRLEIIVVDNHPQDTSLKIKEILDRHKIIYLIEKKRGWANAKNKGIRAATGDFIAFLDADCIADIEWISRIIGAFDSDLIGACGGKVLSYNPKTYIEKYIDKIDYFSQSRYAHGEMSFLPWIMTCNAVYRKSTIERIGDFDNLLRSVEDTDFSWRICLTGLQIKYVEDAIVFHKRKDTMKTIFKQFYNYGYGQVILEKKYNFIIREFVKRGKKDLEMPFNASPYNKKNTISILGVFINLAYLIGKIRAYLSVQKTDFRDKTISFPPNKLYWWWIDENVKILEWKSLSYFLLNKTASEIWDMVNKNKSIIDIKEYFKYKYKIDEESIERDINELSYMLNEYLNIKLINSKNGILSNC